jgi:hypothetical protein
VSGVCVRDGADPGRAKVVEADAVEGLKAAINSFALVHPEHPLRVKGEAGLRVYIGARARPRRPRR